MDWTVEDDMVDGLFCATLTGRKGSHTPFVQAGAETSDTGAEAVERPDDHWFHTNLSPPHFATKLRPWM